MSTNSSEIDDKNALQVYISFVEMTDRSVARRGRINALFITLNSAVISLESFHHAPSNSHALHYIAFGFGIALALVWMALVRYYGNLIRQKLEIVVQMEKDLPFKPYTKLGENREMTENHLRRLCIDFLLPGVFLILYFARFLEHQNWIH